MTDTTVRDAKKAALNAASIRELMAIDSQAFVELCYQRLLGREADPEGRANYLAAWFSGEPKLCLIARLRFGGEGRVKKRVIRGELLALAFYAAWRAPVAGLVFRWLWAFFTLPTVMERSEQALRAAAGNRREVRSSVDELNQVDAFIQLRKAEMLRELGALRAEVEATVRAGGGEPRP